MKVHGFEVISNTIASNAPPSKLPRGVIITGVRQPEQGAVIVHHCKHCKLTEIMCTPYAAKPEDGDLWLITDYCERCWFRAWMEHPMPIFKLKYMAFKTPLELGF